MGGTLRFIFPVRKNIAFTLEGGVNETLLGRANLGRVLAGVQFGNFMRPKELLIADHATPVQVPRVRYEVLSRTVRIGGDAPPVADAGPNQTLVGPATVTLDGSNSSDPNGYKLTYQWTQVLTNAPGTAVVLSNPTSAITTFSAATGETYYFTLTVKDPYGLSNSAHVTITMTTPTTVVTPPTPPIITSFVGSPLTIQQGASSTLSWAVTGADTITITALGNVIAAGSAPVTPQATTTYVLTATKGTLTASQSVTITVTPTTPPPTNPSNAVAITVFGQQLLSDGMTQLSCLTKNAASIMLAGKTFPFTVEAVLEVDPSVPTTYTCVATGADGTQVSQSLVVQ